MFSGVARVWILCDENNITEVRRWVDYKDDVIQASSNKMCASLVLREKVFYICRKEPKRKST